MAAVNVSLLLPILAFLVVFLDILPATTAIDRIKPQTGAVKILGDKSAKYSYLIKTDGPIKDYTMAFKDWDSNINFFISCPKPGFYRIRVTDVYFGKMINTDWGDQWDRFDPIEDHKFALYYPNPLTSHVGISSCNNVKTFGGCNEIVPLTEAIKKLKNEGKGTYFMRTEFTCESSSIPAHDMRHSANPKVYDSSSVYLFGPGYGNFNDFDSVECNIMLEGVKGAEYGFVVQVLDDFSFTKAGQYGAEVGCTYYYSFSGGPNIVAPSCPKEPKQKITIQNTKMTFKAEKKNPDGMSRFWFLIQGGVLYERRNVNFYKKPEYGAGKVTVNCKVNGGTSSDLMGGGRWGHPLFREFSEDQKKGYRDSDEVGRSEGTMPDWPQKPTKTKSNLKDYAPLVGGSVGAILLVAVVVTVFTVKRMKTAKEDDDEDDEKIADS